MNDVLNKTNSIMSEQITMLEGHLNATRKDLTAAQEELGKEQKQGQEQAAAALWSLAATSDANQVMIVDAGAIESLVEFLRKGTAQRKQHAAKADAMLKPLGWPSAELLAASWHARGC